MYTSNKESIQNPNTTPGNASICSIIVERFPHLLPWESSIRESTLQKLSSDNHVVQVLSNLVWHDIKLRLYENMNHPEQGDRREKVDILVNYVSGIIQTVVNDAAPSTIQ